MHESRQASLKDASFLAKHRRCSPLLNKLIKDGISMQALPTAVIKKPITSQRKLEDRYAVKSSIVESLLR
jgi:hypothetical protein